MHLFGLHIKRLINLKIDNATFGIGGQLLPLPPLATCLAPNNLASALAYNIQQNLTLQGCLYSAHGSLAFDILFDFCENFWKFGLICICLTVQNSNNLNASMCFRLPSSQLKISSLNFQTWRMGIVNDA